MGTISRKSALEKSAQSPGMRPKARPPQPIRAQGNTLDLQRAAGNRAVSESLQPPVETPKGVQANKPEELSPETLEGIKHDVAAIVEELKSAFPNKTLIISLISKWDDRDRERSSSEGQATPHLDRLLLLLETYSFPKSTWRTLWVGQWTNALEALWHFLDVASAHGREYFNYMIERSLKYRSYKPGPGIRAIWNWEGRLADDLRERAEQSAYDSVQRGLDDVGSTDRDDVSVLLVSALTDEKLRRIGQSKEGRRLLDRLFDELTAGKVFGAEEQQASRILKIKLELIPEEQYEQALESHNIKIFPYRKTGMQVGALGFTAGAAHITARRLEEGRIRVQMAMHVRNSEWYSQETRTLRLETFTSGIELPENEIVGVKMYDKGGKIEYGPALWLVQISNEGFTQTFEKMGEVAGLGLTLGGGTLAGAGLEATLAARIALWADRAATALGLLTSVISEHRGWIIQNFDSGEEFIGYVDKVNSAIAFYGLTRVAMGMPKLMGGLRASYGAWRNAALRRLGEFAENKSGVVREVIQNEDEILEDIGQIEKQQRTARQAPELRSLEGGRQGPPQPRGKLRLAASHGEPTELPPQPQQGAVPMAADQSEELVEALAQEQSSQQGMKKAAGVKDPTVAMAGGSRRSAPPPRQVSKQESIRTGSSSGEGRNLSGTGGSAKKTRTEERGEDILEIFREGGEKAQPNVTRPAAPQLQVVPNPRIKLPWEIAEEQLWPALEKKFGPGWQPQKRTPAPGAARGQTLASTIPEYHHERLNVAVEGKRFNLEELGLGRDGRVIGTQSKQSVEALGRAELQLAQRRQNLPTTEEYIVFNITGQADDAAAVGKQLKKIIEDRSINYDKVFVQVGRELIEIE